MRGLKVSRLKRDSLLCRRQEHGVDHVDHAVAGCDVGFHDLRIINGDVVACDLMSSSAPFALFAFIAFTPPAMTLPETTW
jgi:hypothetical protein